MLGQYVNGIGRAHKSNNRHKDAFGCYMYGTFNIRMPKDFNINKFKPAIIAGKNTYWLVRLNKLKYGWAVRWKGSKQKPYILEILSKRLFPDSFKSGKIDAEILEKWDRQSIKAWANRLDPFQSFSWLGGKADSESVWDAINIISWSNKSVLNIGCNYGFFSIMASKNGAYVHGVDLRALDSAVTINNHIEMSDVEYYRSDRGGMYDVILYLSVHHQIDPKYNNLRETINKLSNRCSDLFVELIMPPLFGSNEAAIDKAVGGSMLHRYKHKVRGHRKIYHINHDML